MQFLAAVPLLVGLWFTGNKRLLGPFLCFLSELFWIGVGVMHNLWSAILIGAVLFMIQLRNFLKWKAEGVQW